MSNVGDRFVRIVMTIACAVSCVLATPFPRKYLGIKTPSTFDNCVTTCKNWDANAFPATPINQNENDRIKAEIVNKGMASIPLGGHRRADSSNYRWSAGPLGKLDGGKGAIFYVSSSSTCVPYMYCNWNSGEPNGLGSGETQVQMYSTGAWNDINGGTALDGCVCQLTTTSKSMTLSSVSTTASSSDSRAQSASRSLSVDRSETLSASYSEDQSYSKTGNRTSTVSLSDTDEIGSNTDTESRTSTPSVSDSSSWSTSQARSSTRSLSFSNDQSVSDGSATASTGTLTRPTKSASPTRTRSHSRSSTGELTGTYSHSDSSLPSATRSLTRSSSNTPTRASQTLPRSVTWHPSVTWNSPSPTADFTKTVQSSTPSVSLSNSNERTLSRSVTATPTKSHRLDGNISFSSSSSLSSSLCWGRFASQGVDVVDGVQVFPNNNDWGILISRSNGSTIQVSLPYEMIHANPVDIYVTLRPPFLLRSVNAMSWTLVGALPLLRYAREEIVLESSSMTLDKSPEVTLGPINQSTFLLGLSTVTYDQRRRASFLYEFDNKTWQCAGKAVNFTIEVSVRPTKFDISLRDEQVAAITIASVIALTSLSSDGSRVTRAASLQNLVSGCTFDYNSTSSGANILEVYIDSGPVPGRYLRGAVVGNIVLFCGCSLVMIASVLLYALIRTSRNVREAARALACPSILVLPVSVILLPTTLACMTLVRAAEASTTDMALGALGMTFCVLLVGAPLFLTALRTRFGCELVANEQDHTMDAIDYVDGDTTKASMGSRSHQESDTLCTRLLRPTAYWVAKESFPPSWAGQYRCLYRDFRLAWYASFELTVTAFVGIVMGEPTSTSAGCSAKRAGVALLFTLSFAAACYLRPALTAIGNILRCFSEGFLFVTCVVSVAAANIENTSLYNAALILQVVCIPAVAAGVLARFGLAMAERNLCYGALPPQRTKVDDNKEMEAFTDRSTHSKVSVQEDDNENEDPFAAPTSITESSDAPPELQAMNASTASDVEEANVSVKIVPSESLTYPTPILKHLLLRNSEGPRHGDDPLLGTPDQEGEMSPEARHRLECLMREEEAREQQRKLEDAAKASIGVGGKKTPSQAKPRDITAFSDMFVIDDKKPSDEDSDSDVL